MANIIPVKEYLGKMGIKQKYHEPVLTNQKRFYMIQIQSIQVFQDTFKQNFKTNLKNQKNNETPSEKEPVWEGKLTFEIGCRESFTQLKINKDTIPQKQQQKKPNCPPKNKNTSTQKLPTQDKNQQGKGAKKFKSDFDNLLFQFNSKTFKKDLHLFPFEKQEVMTIKFQVLQEIKNDEAQINKEYKKEYGYALVPLVPFIKMPYTQHQVEVELVTQNDKKQTKKNVVAKLNINLFFMHNFKGRLFVEVVKADLERNLALIGQMYPLIRMYVRDMEFQTDVIQEGGIKPHWKSQKQGQFCYFNMPLESVQDDLYIILFYNREVTIDEIVGKLKIDLQDEMIFKSGVNLESYISKIEKKLKKNAEEFDKDKKIKTKEIDQLKQQKKEKQKSGPQQVVSLEQQLESLMKEKLQALRKKRLELYEQKMKEIRKSFIRDLVTKSAVLDPTKPPQFLSEYEQEIRKQFDKKYKEVKKKAKDDYEKKVNEHGNLSQKFIENMNYQLEAIEQDKEIQKVLIDEMKTIGKMMGQSQNMISRTIELKYMSVLPKEADRIVGLLEFRTFFVYDFDFTMKEKESYPNEEFYD